jgi:hypothetical protein
MPVGREGRKTTRYEASEQVATPYAASVPSSRTESEIVRDMAKLDVSKFKYPLLGLLRHINEHAIALEKKQPDANKRNALIRGAMAEIIRKNNLSHGIFSGLLMHAQAHKEVSGYSQLNNMLKSVFFSEKTVDPIRIFSTLESASIAMSTGYDFDKQIEGRTALMETFFHQLSDPNIVIEPEAVKAVYAYNGAQRLNVRDSNNQTAIIYAARAGSSPELMQTLMDCGADPSLQDVTGKNAFMYSAAAGD